ncbi:RidA family protein [Nonomuraea rubra]|uniref:RidA family protein n=1 Tax=Nonomuraea rubra TaxID=46180 RepID=UPI003620CB37
MSALRRVNPPALCPPVQNLYAQVVIAPAGRTAYLAGQVALDASGELVGPGDHAAQARQAFLNVRLALEGVGASPPTWSGTTSTSSATVLSWCRSSSAPLRTSTATPGRWPPARCSACRPSACPAG